MPKKGDITALGPVGVFVNVRRSFYIAVATALFGSAAQAQTPYYQGAAVTGDSVTVDLSVLDRLGPPPSLPQLLRPGSVTPLELTPPAQQGAPGQLTPNERAARLRSAPSEVPRSGLNVPSPRAATPTPVRPAPATPPQSTVRRPAPAPKPAAAAPAPEPPAPRVAATPPAPKPAPRAAPQPAERPAAPAQAARRPEPVQPATAPKPAAAPKPAPQPAAKAPAAPKPAQPAAVKPTQPAPPKPAAAPAPKPAVAAKPPDQKPEETAKTPPPKKVAAVPGEAIERGGGLTITFAPGSSDLPDNAVGALDRLAERLKSDPNMRIQLVGFARTQVESASQARRLSLFRALSVRTHLMKKGVRSTRMDVRALGNKEDDGPPDRVDLVVPSGT